MLEIKEAPAVPLSAAEEGDLTMDLHEDKNKRREAPSTVFPASDATAAGSDEYYFVATSAKKSITRGDGKARSFQVRTGRM